MTSPEAALTQPSLDEVGGDDSDLLATDPRSIGPMMLVWPLVVAVLFGLIWLAGGIGPVDAMAAVWDGTFGGIDPIAELLVRAAPLVVVGVGAAFALRAGVFNVGGEGQMAVGAVAAVLALNGLAGAPPVVAWTVGLVAALLGGALWATVPAWLSARRGVSEILSTLLFNFMTINLLTWLLTATPLQDPDPYVITAQGAPLADPLRFPVLIGGTRLHVGVAIAGIAVLLAMWAMRTPIGLAVDLIGANRSLAAQGGLRPEFTRVGLLLFSAAAAGVAGAIQLFGISHRLTPGLTSGVGYTGLLVAVIGRGRPLNTALAALIFAFLTLGGEALERTGVPRAVSLLAQGLAVVAVALQGRNR